MSVFSSKNCLSDNNNNTEVGERDEDRVSSCSSGLGADLSGLSQRPVSKGTARTENQSPTAPFLLFGSTLALPGRL